MKLSEINLERFRDCRQLKLRGLTDGLNVVYCPNHSSLSSLQSFLPAIFYGPQLQGGYKNALADPRWPHGHIHVQSGGHSYRLSRPESTTYSDLFVSDLLGTQVGRRTPELLAQLDRTAYETFFNLRISNGGWSPGDLAAQISAHFQVGLSTAPFHGNPAGYERWKAEADRRQFQMGEIQKRIQLLEVERNKLREEADRQCEQHQNRIASLEIELAEIQKQIDTQNAVLHEQRQRRTELLDKHPALSSRTDQDQPLAKQAAIRTATNQCAELYHQLDDIDLQIRRWRNVQSGIQHERVQIRDQMIDKRQQHIESSEHPDHDARQILVALEDKLDQAEHLASSQNHPIETPSLRELCSNFRDGLHALSQELWKQYKQVCQRAAVSQLRQLRRWYHEMEDNIKALLHRRDSVIEEIRQLDPDGADLISNADIQFCQSAQREGYLKSRHRFGGSGRLPFEANFAGLDDCNLSAPPTIAAEFKQSTSEVDQLIDQLTIELEQTESRRERKRQECNRLRLVSTMALTDRLNEVASTVNSLKREAADLAREIDDDRRNSGEKPSYLLSEAARYLRQLSAGHWDYVWIHAGNEIKVQQRNGQVCSLYSLDEKDADDVCLCLVLASIEQFALRGVRFPVVIHECDESDFCGPGITRRRTNSLLFATLESFSQNGHQVLVLTNNREMVQQASKNWTNVCELADTEVTVPMWYPDAPTLPRNEVSPDEYENGISAKRSFVPTVIDQHSPAFHKNASFPDTTRGTAAPLCEPIAMSNQPGVNVDDQLYGIDLVESIYLSALDACGIHSVSQLLNIDCQFLETDLVNRGFTSSQIERWQAQAWLVVSIPSLQTSEARVLVGSGIEGPERLEAMDASDVRSRIVQFFESSAGRRSSVSVDHFDIRRIEGWKKWLRDNSSWRSEIRKRGRTHTKESEEPTTNRQENVSRENKTANSPCLNTRGSDRSGDYRFFLDLADDIKSAPSVGAKSAERFHRIGIRDVRQFLNADADSMANELDNRRMSAKTIRKWQKQSHMMCCVPNLRAYEAQLLVACGINELEQLAEIEPEKLMGIVGPFCKTKEGIRMLRSSKKPELAEVAEWINSAKHGRPLQAA